jgi:DNA-binding NtrC family response regulator
MIGGPQGAAARLGLKRTTLISKMKRLGIYQPVRQAVIDQINEREESEPLVKREAEDESSGSTDALALR